MLTLESQKDAVLPVLNNDVIFSNLAVHSSYLPPYANSDQEEESEEVSKKRKPWGDSAHFCPLAFLEQGVLWPGNQDTAAKYRERLYYFSSEEAKEQFTASPKEYTASGGPLQVGIRFGIIKYLSRNHGLGTVELGTRYHSKGLLGIATAPNLVI